MADANGKEDKYEQLLAKIDWRAPHPPRGYQYGVGRGAKGFVTTAELTTAGANGAKMTREENDFFSAMERMEGRARAAKKGRYNDEDDAGAVRGAARETSVGTSAKVKLSLDDLATLELPSASSSSSPVAKAAEGAALAAGGSGSVAALVPTQASKAPTAPTPPVTSLVVRSARTEEGEAAEEHIFADERVLTPYDLLKGKVSAAQAGLHNVLAMGSTEEQTTWITHARAYREMGMTRRAYQTLVEGCAVTGKKGKRIWEERLRYLAKADTAGRRRLLEEATQACPTEEELWTQLLEVVPPLDRIPCLQRAVLACPSSEQLWLRLVQFVPSIHDQRVLLQKALQHTPHLPLLWARIARLESYQTGKEMFQAAAARFPSLALIIEAAKYVEWYALSRWAAEASPQVSATCVGGTRDDYSGQPHRSSSQGPAQLYAALHTADSEVADLVRTAQQNYLSLSEVGSRHAWLSLALSLLSSDAKGSDSPEMMSAEEKGELTVAGQPAAAMAKTGVYICTAAHMFLSVVDPNHKGLITNAVPATWLSDLVALLPSESAAQHEVQCALWYTWVLLQKQYMEHVVKQSRVRNDDTADVFVSSSPPPAAPLPVAAAMSAASTKESLAILEAVFRTAPSVTLQTELSWQLQQVLPKKAEEEEGSGEGKLAAGESHPAAGQDAEEEEEEEELGKPAAVATAAAANAPLSSSSAPQAHSLPSPLAITVAATLGLTARATTVITTATASPLDVSHQRNLTTILEMLLVEMPLTLSEALYRCGCHSEALSVVNLALHSDDAATSASNGVLDVTELPSPSSPESPEDTPTAVPPPARLQQRHHYHHLFLFSDLGLHVARAKLLAVVGDNVAADHCLLDAINAASAHNKSSGCNFALLEETWVKLAVLRRSQRQPIESVLQDALRQCPCSWRLWLMLLEEKRRVINTHQQELSASLTAAKHAGAPSPSTAEMLRLDASLADEVREIRMLCKKALSADHCHAVAAVWIFAAQRIEAELLHNVPAARALLTDAASACAAAVYSTRSQLLARALTPQEMERQASALAQIGVAQAKLEMQYGTPGQALETVQEVLQRLPKTRDGTFAVTQDDAVGELQSLFIALEPPASRGRAAAQVMRQWKSREPLALCAVAQLYYSAGQYARALDQALKAVQVSKGRCGDAIGLLWRMADQSVMRPFVHAQLHGRKGDNGEGGEGNEGNVKATTAEDVSRDDLTPEMVQRWVLAVTAASAAGAGAVAAARSGGAGGGVSAAEEGRLVRTSFSSSSATAVPSAELVTPKSGPLWITVAKKEDPTNVAIRGYRRPVIAMLREVANRIELKENGSGADAALLRLERVL
jgi:tetratricopeptide (TPR) repeat protein